MIHFGTTLYPDSVKWSNINNKDSYNQPNQLRLALLLLLLLYSDAETRTMFLTRSSQNIEA